MPSDAGRVPRGVDRAVGHAHIEAPVVVADLDRGGQVDDDVVSAAALGDDTLDVAGAVAAEREHGVAQCELHAVAASASASSTLTYAVRWSAAQRSWKSATSSIGCSGSCFHSRAAAASGVKRTSPAKTFAVRSGAGRLVVDDAVVRRLRLVAVVEDERRAVGAAPAAAVGEAPHRDVEEVVRVLPEHPERVAEVVALLDQQRLRHRRAGRHVELGDRLRDRQSSNATIASSSADTGIARFTWNWWPTPSTGTPRAISRSTSAW